MSSHYQVLERFDPDKNYKINIQPRFLKFFSLLKEGETINPTKFANTNHESLGTAETSFGNSLWIVKTGLSHGIKMGIIPFNDFGLFRLNFMSILLS